MKYKIQNTYYKIPNTKYKNTFPVNHLLFRPLPGLFTRTANRTLSFQPIDL